MIGGLKPFIRYYGGKWRAAPHYPKPAHSTIIEPFAGGAGYSLRYFDRDVILIEKYAALAEMWRYLISVSSSEILSIPYVESTEELPSWVPEGGRVLVGFAMNAAVARPRVSLSAGRKKLRERGRIFEGWSHSLRSRVADQVEKIRHWRVIEGEYWDAPDTQATWFIDPPYSCPAGRHYVHNMLDYQKLGEWCHGRPGQVIVCEADGATWLPFSPFREIKAMSDARGARVSKEAIYYVEKNTPSRRLG